MRAFWFGDSWTWGSELEKCIGPDYQQHDQEAYRVSNRFSALVCHEMGWQEINRGQPGISADRLVLSVTETNDITKDDLVFVVWPSFSRYFWIDEDQTQHDIRVSDQWASWYKNVDTYPYQMYNAQRAVWSLNMYLTNNNIKHFFINSVYKITEPWYYNIDQHVWMGGPNWRVSDVLEFDPDKGYPPLSTRHKSLYPCENHPNLYGHKSIAREIIKFLHSHNEKNNERTKSYQES